MMTDGRTSNKENMHRNLMLDHLSNEECEKILQVLQKDFELREKEKQRLEKIEEDLKEEDEKTDIIAKKSKLNEDVCVRCCQKFGIIFNRKQMCLTCKLYVCKRCADYSDEIKGYTCHACIKERELKLKSFEWFYNNVSRKFKRFGSAKVVRSLYKQRSARSRAYHTDNESDTGYDPSFLNSLRTVAQGGDSTFYSEGEAEIESIGPAPITPTLISQASSVETLNNDRTNNNAEVKDTDNIKDSPREKSKDDIYKEAFEHYKQTEEKKFNTKFDILLGDLNQSLEQPVLNGGSNFGSTSYGEVLEKYQKRLRELLVGVSQRLEMAVESFDSTPSQSATDTSQKVRKLVSKLVEDSFGESIDVTSDEAVSDLSSLSDDSGDHQVKSFEDQLAHAVVARVLENFSRDRNIDIQLDFIDGNLTSNHVSDIRSHGSDNKSHEDFTSRGASSDEENSVVTKVERHSQSEYTDSGKFEVVEVEVNELSDTEENVRTSNEGETEEEHNRVIVTNAHSFNDSYDVISEKDLEEHTPEPEDSNVEVCVKEDLSQQEATTECVHPDRARLEFEELKQIAKNIASPRHQIQSREIEESLEEELIEPVTVHREETHSEFASRLDTFDRVHDTRKYLLPDFSEDYEDNEFFQNEVDPDLLSMNLAPILEEDEENYLEDEEEEDSRSQRVLAEKSWRDNWIFNRSTMSPYSNMGKTLVGQTMDEVYVTVPQPDEELAARVGTRDADQMSDDLSEGHEDSILDDEVSFFAKSRDEITRITSRRSTPSPQLPQSSTSVQTDHDSDTSMDTSVSLRSQKKEVSYIEELIPAEGSDPKFDIPPDSVVVKEGEPAKFSCRVSGTEPIDVIWYRVEDGDLTQLEDSEDYEKSKDNNKHGVTVFNTSNDMAGQFMCMAINEKAHCSQYHFLKVKKNNQEMKKPEFLKTIEDQEVKEGHHVKFRAKVKGYPLPRVVWYKDGNFLHSDSNYKIEKFGNRDYILTINYATPEDDAEYWIYAKNVAGEAKSTAQLIVESKQLDNSPKSKAISITPIRNKDEQQLTNMGRKLFMTREKVEEETESMMESADKLTDMHHSLDQFDAMLSTFEQEIGSCNPSDSWDSDTLLNHNLQQGVQNYNSMKTSAEHIRNTTSSALQLLKSTENLLNNSETEPDMFVTSTPRENVSPISRQDQENNNLPSDRESDQIISVSDNIQPIPLLDLSDKTVTCESVQSQLSLEPELTSVQKSENYCSNSRDDDEPTVINFGPKEVPEDLYSRDYYIGGKQTSPRQWEVKSPPYSPRSRTSSQGNLQATEEEVASIERSLDLNNCPIITTTQQTEESISTSSLSPSLSIDSGFSSIRDKPQQTHLYGETSEQDIPESRTEINDEMGGVELPSVNRLKSLFSSGKGEDPASVKRVHSITGRNVPKEKLEKYRSHLSPLTRPVQNVDQPTPGRSNLIMNLSSNHPGVKQVDAEPTQIFPEKKGDLFPQTTPAKPPRQNLSKNNSVEDDTQAKVSMPSTKTKPAPQPPISTSTVNVSFQSKQTIHPVSVSGTNTPSSGQCLGSRTNVQKQTSLSQTGTPVMAQNSSLSASGPSTSSAGSSQSKGKARIRAGCISARASFWEKRIQGEETKEEDYPEIIEHVDD